MWQLVHTTINWSEDDPIWNKLRGYPNSKNFVRNINKKSTKITDTHAVKRKSVVFVITAELGLLIQQKKILLL